MRMCISYYTKDLYSVGDNVWGFEHTILVGMGTACTGSYAEFQLP